MAMFAQDRLRMELHTLHRPPFMAQTHDLAIVLTHGRDLQAFRQIVLRDYERVIAGRRKRVGKATKDARPSMRYERGTRRP